MPFHNLRHLRRALGAVLLCLCPAFGCSPDGGAALAPALSPGAASWAAGVRVPVPRTRSI